MAEEKKTSDLENKKKEPSLTGVEFVDPEKDLGFSKAKKSIWLKIIFVITILFLLISAAAYMHVLPSSLTDRFNFPKFEKEIPKTQASKPDVDNISKNIKPETIEIKTVEITEKKDKKIKTEKNVSVLEIPKEVSALPEMMGSIEGRLSRLEVLISELTEKSFTDELLMISFVQLNQAIGQGSPFTSELGTFKTFASEDNNIRENFVPFLEKNAARGISTYYQLKQDFEDLKIKATKNKKTIASSVKGVWGHVKHYFSSLIVLQKRNDEEKNKKTQSSNALKNAETALRKNNFRAAFQIIDNLEINEKKLFQDWINQATQRFDADDKLSSLQTYLMTRLTVKRKLMTTIDSIDKK